MPYEHLQLVKLPESLERRKQPAPVPPPIRAFKAHSERLTNELDLAVSVQQHRRPNKYVDPSLILKVQMSGLLQEEEWERLGLRVVASEPNHTLVLFSTADDLSEFRRRISAYSEGPPPGQKGPQYSGFIGGIENVSTVTPSDRIGERMRSWGLLEIHHFESSKKFVVDIELWEMGARAIREHRLAGVSRLIESSGGAVLDEYVGPSITMLRAEVSGDLLVSLLSIEDIATIDLPPVPDMVTSDALKLDLESSPEMQPISANAQLIGIIDSGITDHPYLRDVIAGSIGVPASLGTADDWGHGTRVAGVAVFGDLRAQIENKSLERGARICTAKVINSRGQFDDSTLIVNQMREALSRLNSEFGCRIFVIALADITKPYAGGKLGPWSTTLDELARELDILIIVSAGNRMPRSGDRVEEGVTQYPKYLTEPSNRFYEPAGGVNVLTVGALAHGEGLDIDASKNIYLRPTAKEDQPSAFTRVGPGVGGSIKPDLVDVGGTMVFDGLSARLRNGEQLPSAGILTTHHDFVNRLITAGSGTSYSAPRTAFAAAQILEKFPAASSNLLKALLVNSARVPAPSASLLENLGQKAINNICGHGRPDLNKAAYSDSARVVMYAEDSLALDYFAVYRIPIPKIFQNTQGERSIKVTLVFDPTVRNGRLDYMGYGMSYRLIRGCDSKKIFEHYRRRHKDDGVIPEMEARFNCQLVPKPTLREKSAIQSSTCSFKRNVDEYGNDYYLVVRSESGWDTTAGSKKFALVVELSHRADIALYERVQEAVRVQVRV